MPQLTEEQLTEEQRRALEELRRRWQQQQAYLAQFPPIAPMQIQPQVPLLETPPPQLSWWQSAMQPVGRAFEWYHRQIVEPGAAGLWGLGVRAMPGMQAGEAELRQAGGFPWGAGAVEAYRGAETPWGVKGALELFGDPLMYLGAAGLARGIAGKAGMAGIARALGPIARVEQPLVRAMAAPIELPLRGIARGVRALRPRAPAAPAAPTAPVRPLALEFPTTQEVLQEAYRPNAFRRLAEKISQRPWGGAILQRLHPSAVQGSELRQSYLVLNRLEEQADDLASQVASDLMARQSQMRNPFIMNDEGLITNITQLKLNPEGRLTQAMNDVFQWGVKDGRDTGVYRLMPDQVDFIDRAQYWVKEKAAWEIREGIPLLMRTVREGEFFPRIVLGKGDIDKLRSQIRSGLKGWQKQPHREYELAIDAMQQDVRYEKNPVAIVATHVRAAGHRIAAKRAGEMVRAFGRTPTGLAQVIAPQVLTEATQTARRFAAAKGLLAITQRAIRREQLPSSTIRAMERHFPGMGEALKAAIRNRPDIRAAESKLIASLRQTEARLTQVRDALTVEKTARAAAEARVQKIVTAPTDEKLRQAFEVMHADDRDLFHIMLEQQRENVAETLDGLSARSGALREALTSDPVATFSFEQFIPARLRAGKQLPATTAHRRLVEVLGRMAEQRGPWPESLTVKEAAMLLRGRTLRASAMTPQGRVRWEYVLDELATDLGFPNEDALLRHIKQIRGMEDEIADLNILAGDAKNRLAQLDNTSAILRQADEALTGPPLPIQEPGMPEAGLQAGMMGVPPQVVRPLGRGKLTQLSMEEALKLAEARGVPARQAEILRLRPAEVPPIGLPPAPPAAPAPKPLESLQGILRVARGLVETTQGPYWQAKHARAGLMGRVRGAEWLPGRAAVAFGREASEQALAVRTLRVPALQGLIFEREIGDEIEKLFGDQASRLGEQLAKWAAVPRALMTTLDIGAMQLQLLPLLARSPGTWARVARDSIEVLFDPAHIARYEAQNADIIAEITRYAPGWLGAPEFVEAALTGPLAKLAVTRKVYGPFARLFAAQLKMGITETHKALRETVLRTAARKGVSQEQALAELAKHSTHICGVTSTKALGFSAGARAWQAGAIFFAPRYTISAFSVLADAIQGGIRGQLARDAIGKMLGAGILIHCAISAHLGKIPNLDPSSGKFLTIEVAGQHIGPGSVWVALARFAANNMRTMMEDPTGYLSIDTRDNPLLRFYRSRSAVFTSDAWDILTGKTFMGEPTRDSVLDFSENVIAQDLLPFWLENALLSQPRPGPTGVLAGVGAMRTWPLQFWEQRDVKREQYAQEDYGKAWRELNILQQKQLVEAHADLQDITRITEQERARRGGVEEKRWLQWNEENLRNRQILEDTLNQFQRQANAGLMSGREFRIQANAAFAQYRAMREQMEDPERRPEYRDIYRFLAEPRERVKLEDTAFDEYMALMYQTDALEDEYGRYDYAEADRRKQHFRNQWGDEIYQYVQARLAFGKEEPPLMRELRTAREILRPYWEIRDRLMGMSPRLAELERQLTRLSLINPEMADQMRGRVPQLERLERMVRQKRQRMLAANPLMKRYLQMFYY